ncbi:aminodeoxychorismate synthase component I [Marinobacter nanhaiticus D15-8W]|uniref:Aminodeoxychorismate synthase component I n=1 Tax=Marinobacter nanhaiticus D15-8W TaxID=626887 RepID=N6WRT6_9GAMM|nr:aminodeoxychorismate synthase component I [Marinobacter nanhaiticus]ENO14241.1 aminodeoxychorismate synthase component I [Marinobacter nanhaiticus D15-8W]BES71628.1 aminodeoxychorismate synthase component I [Marinobacter nanhaiticus D15-8W]
MHRADGSAFASAWPARTWRLPQDEQAWQKNLHELQEAERQLQLKEHSKAAEELFAGGLVGAINYEAAKHTVAGYVPQSYEQNLPDVGWVGEYLWALNLPSSSDDRPRLVIHPHCPPSIMDKLKPLIDEAEQPAGEPLNFRMVQPFQPEQTQAQYHQRVQRILDYILAGDCYQVNLSQRFSGQFTGHPFAAFKALTSAIPVPHAGYVDTGLYQVLSISPERYLRIHEGVVESKPIKGTRPRGETDADDRKQQDNLAASLKDRAENLMIVDLIRNDISRFCKPFSVKVPKLFAIESYRNVHQLVSTVTGELDTDVSLIDALLSAFPGGSITGAPKRRAMEIIDELEPHDRGPYCGSVFYISADGTLESNIAIRTLMTRPDGTISCWGGGGIVADSEPEAEYEESITKVRRLMETLEGMG